MDTGSHLLFGLTLAGLAAVDPHVAAHPELLPAMVSATMIGSHAPDFDSFMRLKGKAAYIRTHRGVTHSLPAPIVWALLIGCGSAAIFDQWSFLPTLVLWTFAAVCFHIALDLLNGYGVQCLRPFSRKWWHLDALCLFDPYLFALHTVSAIAWLFLDVAPAPLFAVSYGLTALYIIWRLAVHGRTMRIVRGVYPSAGTISLLPSLSGRVWQFTAEMGNSFRMGKVRDGIIIEEAVMPKTPEDSLPPQARATLGTDVVRTFLGFADRIHVNVSPVAEGYEVVWSDVRFWTNNKMPFGTAVTLDPQLNVLRERIGWDKKTWEPPHV
ncbi:metal-dependent hydrolase [Paenibacillus xanthanilyticus]|uniref:Metal-dependent hydrolase n=1 Tax=Paenibacillus xanthanilyticus TaxID=1783531 RepID=A0ABV8K509_9BACL